MSEQNKFQKQEVRWLLIDAKYQGQRIDNFLRKSFPALPKAYVYRILRRGEIRVNSKRVKPTYRLHTEDKVRLPPMHLPEQPQQEMFLKTTQSQALRAMILFEDEAILVLNKPSGLAVHGGSGLKFGLINQIRLLGESYKHAELVHRLDRGTSGCLLLVKDRRYLKSLHEAWPTDRVVKRYLAWVKGAWPAEVEMLKNRIKKVRHKEGSWSVITASEGKAAETHVVVRQYAERVTELSLSLQTGRTHQIRVQCAAQGHPVVGDDKYGDFSFNRQMKTEGYTRLMLHAEALTFPHPITEAPVEVRCPFKD